MLAGETHCRRNDKGHQLATDRAISDSDADGKCLIESSRPGPNSLLIQTFVQLLQFSADLFELLVK